MKLTINTKTGLAAILLIAYGSLKSQTSKWTPFQSKVNGKYGYYDKNTLDTLVKAKYDQAFSFNNNYIASVQKNGLYGFINCKGDEITPFKYTLTWGNNEGYYKVMANGNYGLIDSTGKEVLPLIYNYVYEFQNGYCVVVKNSKFGLMNRNFKLEIDFKYKELTHLHDNIYKAKLENKIGLITQKDRKLTPFIYDKIYYPQCGCFLAIKDKKPILIGKNGQEKDFLFADHISGMTNFCGIVLNNKYGVIDKNGNYTIEPKYDYIGYFENEISVACIGCAKDSTGHYSGGKWGYIDIKGKEITPMMYDMAFPFKHGRGEAIISGRLILIDKNGKEETPINAEPSSRAEN